MIYNLKKALNLPVECKHKIGAKGIINDVMKDPKSADLLISCIFAGKSLAIIPWSEQRKTFPLSFERDKMTLCGKVYDALLDPSKEAEVMEMLLALEPPVIVEEIQSVEIEEAVSEDLETPEEVVAELEAYYDSPKSESGFDDTTNVAVFIPADSVEEAIEQPEFEIEIIEEPIEEVELMVDQEEATVEEILEVEAVPTSVPRHKKKRK